MPEIKLVCTMGCFFHVKIRGFVNDSETKSFYLKLCFRILFGGPMNILLCFRSMTPVADFCQKAIIIDKLFF